MAARLPGRRSGQRGGVAQRGAVQGHDPVLARHRRPQARDRLVVADLEDLDRAGDRLTGPHRGLEVPFGPQEDRAGAGQVLGHHGVQDAARHATLHDDPAEARPRGGLLVVVQRIAVAGHLGEALDVARLDATGALGALPWTRRAVRPCGHGTPIRLREDTISTRRLRRSPRNRAMAMVPQMGPMASSGTAPRQPSASTATGRPWIVAIVSRNPTAVWAVRAVPT